MTYIVDLLGAWRGLVRRELSDSGFLVEGDGAGEESAEFRWETLQRRLVDVRPRRVSTSWRLDGVMTPGLRSFLSKVTRGDSLNPHNSKSVAYEDALLNDWGISHFHLGLAPDKGDARFVERTNELLFAVVREDVFYAIDVRAHGSWVARELLETIHECWPFLLQDSRLTGVQLSEDWGAEERAEFRKAGVTVAMTMKDGTVYLSPGGGTGTDGANVVGRKRRLQPTGNMTSWAVAKRRRLLSRIEADLLERRSHVVSVIEAVVGRGWNVLRFDLRLEDGELVVVEANTGVRFGVEKSGRLSI